MSIRRSHAKGREEFLIGAAWEELSVSIISEHIKPDHSKALEHCRWSSELVLATSAMDIQQ